MYPCFTSHQSARFMIVAALSFVVSGELPALAHDENHSAAPARITTRLDEATKLLALSRTEEERLGREMDQEIRRTYKVSTNRALSNYVQEVFQKLAPGADSEMPLSVTVLDDRETVNAFAIPGGYTYITTGMMRHLDSEAELAAVLGHEIGHITEKHIHSRARTMTGASILTKLLGKLTGRDVAGSKVAQVGKFLLLQKFSRSHEYAADTAGVRLMAKAGYDPSGMVSLQDKLYKLSQGSLNIEFLASHPSSAKRRDEIASYIQASGLTTGGSTLQNRSRYQSIKSVL